MKDLKLGEIPKINSGKVREIFSSGDHLLMVATDRISAFDVVLPDVVEHKGKILTQMSEFWFEQTRDIVSNHLISTEVGEFPSSLHRFQDQLRGRSMLVRRCQPLPIECVVRGFLAGSGWKEYQQGQSLCGIALPAGLSQSDRLPEPIFTPSTKATSGHDENISFDQASQIVGESLAERVRTISLDLYRRAYDYAEKRGIIICDTKFEFGLAGDQLLLIDEALTPDSSRFWPADRYQPGQPQPSYDKQFIRDYLETLDWDKTAPGPSLPADILKATSDLYVKAFERLTGRSPRL